MKDICLVNIKGAHIGQQRECKGLLHPDTWLGDMEDIGTLVC